MKRTRNDSPTRNRREAAPTCIDLFCGCGGFSLGMIRAGFRVLAAVDFNTEAVETARLNLGTESGDAHARLGAEPIQHVIQADLTTFGPEELAQRIRRKTVDVIIGGPPCQGFSNARQRDGANHGTRRLIEDDRRHLYRDFFRFVRFFRPRVFVMENVLGIKSAAGGEYYTRVMHEARQLGYRVQSQIEDAYRLGVPQKRRRKLFIGVQLDIPLYFPGEVPPAPRARSMTNLGAALSDLPPLQAGQGSHEADYDLRLRGRAYQRDANAKHYLLKVLEIEKADKLNGHVARPHNETDIACFKSLRKGENSATALLRDPSLKFPYNRETFKDRYTRQHPNRPCSTIVAHLSKDGLMFIHPNQSRSLTPREAARIQSFPDWFEFPQARTHSFRMIGNAVPPLVAEAVGIELLKFLQHCRDKRCSSSPRTLTSRDARFLTELRSQPPEHLRLQDVADLLKAWQMTLRAFPELHPSNARDHGDVKALISMKPHSNLPNRTGEPYNRRYKRSGWPVSLAALAAEVLRRYDRGYLTEDDLFDGRIGTVPLSAKRGRLQG